MAANPSKPAVPVICIGNLTAGGTGKTPLTMTLAHGLAAMGHRPHILTRGYRGRLKGPIQVDLRSHFARDVGDEALLLASVAPTWVGRDRCAAAHAAASAGSDILLMDDGHQNFSIAKNLSVIVVDGEVGFGNGRVIPAGPLREAPAHGLARADALVVMGRPAERTLRQIRCWRGPIFHAHLEPQPNAVRGRYIAFAGIGRPEKFFATLEEAGAQLIERIGFPDHYPYKDDEMAALLARARAADARVITTAKDATRLTAAQRAQIDVLHVTAVFPVNEAFGSFVMERLESAPRSPRNAPKKD